MTIRQSLLALSALTLPAAASAQYGSWPMPRPCAAAAARRRSNRRRRGRRAVDGAARRAQARGQPWQSPIAEPNKAPALEPIDLPPAIEQGVDMIYIDEELVPRAVHDNAASLAEITFAAWSGAPVDLFTSVNPIYTELRRGLVKYRQRWGGLPQIPIPAGPTLKPVRPATASPCFARASGLPDGDKI